MDHEEPMDLNEQTTDQAAAKEESTKAAAPSSVGTITLSKEEYTALQRDASEYKDKYFRALADMENARKRLMRERDENAQASVAEVICDFLAPMDHMEHALEFAEQMSPEVQTWATGFQMILMQFKEILSANGVSPIVALGHLFDPNYHEAIETVETDTAVPDTVVEECRRGYRMGKRTIRPSRVKVAKAVSSTPQEPWTPQ